MEQGIGLSHGVGAVLSVSHVLLVLCDSGSEFDRIETWLQSFENTWELVALVSSDKSYRFFDISPEMTKRDRADWLGCVKKRWQTARPDIQSLPSPRTSILGLIFPWLATAIIKRRFENVKKKPKSEVERCRGGMGISNAASEKLCREDEKLLDYSLKILCPFFTRHDDLGKYYSNVFRTTCLLVPVLIAASTVLAITAVVDLKRHDLWHIVEAILLVSAAWLFLKSKISKQNAMWVEHRLTTELMRSSILCTLLHVIPRIALPSEEPGTWVRQTCVFWTYIRALPILPFSTRKEDLLSARRSAVRDYVTFQESWHRDFSAQHYSAQKWLVRISSRAFLATLIIVVFQLGIAYSQYSGEGLTVELAIATLIFASGAFVLSMLAHQLGFEAIAERSENAARHFQRLRTEIDRCAHSADAKQVYAWADECCRAILAEQHSWYRHIPLIQIEL